MEDWITPVLTLVLLLITAYYAWQTRKTVQAMQEANEANNRPVISVEVRERAESISFMDLVIINAGNGLARDISFEVKGENFTLNGTGMTNGYVKDFRPIKNGVKVLAPKESRKYWFISAIGRVDELQSIDTKLKIRYSNHNKTKHYSDTFEFDFPSMPQYQLGDDPMHKLSKESEKIRKELEQIRRGMK